MNVQNMPCTAQVDNCLRAAFAQSSTAKVPTKDAGPTAEAQLPHLATNRGYIEKTNGAYRFMHASGCVHLNESAADILFLCDGTRTGEQIIASIVQKRADSTLADHVRSFLEAATRCGWIEAKRSR